MILDEVYLATAVTDSDWGLGKQWPPDRGQARTARFRLQHAVSRGDFRNVLKLECERTVVVDRIGSFIDTITAMLLTTEPGEDIADAKVRYALSSMIENVAGDALKHGRGLMAIVDGEPRWLDIRYAWPYEDTDNWVFVEPVVTIDSVDGRPDNLRVLAWNGESIGGSQFVYESAYGTGTIGKQLFDIPDVSAKLSVVDRPPGDGKWGTPAVDAIVPTAAELIRRDSGVSYVVDKNIRPKLMVPVNTADIKALVRLLKEGGTMAGEVTEIDLDFLMEVMEDHDTIVVPDGLQLPQLLTWEGSLPAAFEFRDAMEQAMSQQTGLAPVEPGDRAEVESGVAIARRNFGAVVKTARLFTALYNSAQEVFGKFKWEYIGKRMVQETMNDAVDEPPEGSDGN